MRSEIDLAVRSGRLGLIVCPSGNLIGQNPDSLLFKTFDQAFFPAYFTVGCHTMRIKVTIADHNAVSLHGQIGEYRVPGQLCFENQRCITHLVPDPIEGAFKRGEVEPVPGEYRSGPDPVIGLVFKNQTPRFNIQTVEHPIRRSHHHFAIRCRGDREMPEGA